MGLLATAVLLAGLLVPAAVGADEPSCLELEKSTQEAAYFNGTVVTYTYNVTNNCGCDLSVDVVDDNATPGDTTDDVAILVGGIVIDGGSWSGTHGFELICEEGNYHSSTRTNVATAEGTCDGSRFLAEDSCTVTIFQWLPRTIGFWGNWDNHYPSNEFASLLADALDNSDNLEDLANGVDGTYGTADDWYGEGNVHDFLLGKPPIKKKVVGEDAYARFLMEKQFLATWLNVKAYWEWVADDSGTGLLAFPGTGDVGMDPNATVYLTGEAEVALFGGSPTVIDILDTIESEKGVWEAEQFQVAYGVLDEMNNAEHNHYSMFMPAA